MAVFSDAGIFREIVGGDLDILILAFENPAQGLAGKLGNFAFERPDTGFPGIIADQITECVFAKRKLAFFQTMSLDLLFDQMAFCNLDLLVFRSSRGCGRLSELAVVTNMTSDRSMSISR